MRIYKINENKIPFFDWDWIELFNPFCLPGESLDHYASEAGGVVVNTFALNK
jgi:hypothetical protein